MFRTPHQGQELWDFSLVDPDSRRPVDFDVRRKLLDELQREAARGPSAQRRLARRLALNPSDPRLKLYVVCEQSKHSHVVATRISSAAGRYPAPLAVAGSQANHVCAFAREDEAASQSTNRSVIVIVPRLMARLAHDVIEERGSEHGFVPLGKDVWLDTRILLPDATAGSLRIYLPGKCVHLMAT